MLSHVSSQPGLFSSSDEWYSLTLDDSPSPLASSSSSTPSCRSASSLSPPRSLAERRQHQRRGKAAAGEFLTPLSPHLCPRTPFCSPISSPNPLAPASALSLLAASSLLSPAWKASGSGGQYAAQLTVHTAAAASSASAAASLSSLSPHSARSHSVPFLAFHPFEDGAGDESPLSPLLDAAFPPHCTPFPSPVQPLRRPASHLAPPSPLLVSRPAAHADFSSTLVVPASLAATQPPLSPACVPLTPPSSPLPPPLRLSSASPLARVLSVPSLC